MSVQKILQESIEKNPLGLKEAFVEELRARLGLALEAKMYGEELEEIDESWSDGISSRTAHVHAIKAREYNNKAKDSARIAKMYEKGSPEHNKHMGDYHSATAKAIKSSYHAGQWGDMTTAKKDYKEEMTKAKEYRSTNESFDLSDFTVEEIEDFMMSEDFDQLDEISTELKKRYVEKGGQDVVDRFTGRGKYEKPRNPENFTKTGRPKKSVLNSPAAVKYREKLDNRRDIVNKVSQEVHGKKRFGEEVEHIEEAAGMVKDGYYVTNQKDGNITHDKPFQDSRYAISHANRGEDKTGYVHRVHKVKNAKIKATESFDLSDLTLEELEDFMMSEEFEQLDELSPKTLRSYIKKADKHVDKLNKVVDRSDKIIDKHDLAKARAKGSTRMASNARSDSELRRAVTQGNRDDRSVNTLAQKAKDAEKAKYDANKKIDKREIGIDRAYDRLHKESFDLSDYTVEELEDFMMSEDFDQLDEISTSKLARYMKKASDDLANNAANREFMKANLPDFTDKDEKTKEKVDNTFKKMINKRKSGIAQAASKIVNKEMKRKFSNKED